MKSGIEADNSHEDSFKNLSVMHKWMRLRTTEGKQTLRALMEAANDEDKRTMLNSLTLQNKERTISAAWFAQNAAEQGDVALKDLFIEMFTNVLLPSEHVELASKETGDAETEEDFRPLKRRSNR